MPITVIKVKSQAEEDYERSKLNYLRSLEYWLERYVIHPDRQSLFDSTFDVLRAPQDDRSVDVKLVFHFPVKLVEEENGKITGPSIKSKYRRKSKHIALPPGFISRMKSEPELGELWHEIIIDTFVHTINAKTWYCCVCGSTATRNEYASYGVHYQRAWGNNKACGGIVAGGLCFKEECDNMGHERVKKLGVFLDRHVQERDEEAMETRALLEGGNDEE